MNGSTDDHRPVGPRRPRVLGLWRRLVGLPAERRRIRRADREDARRRERPEDIRREIARHRQHRRPY